ncbi:adenosylmethionine decarboxylase [Celerinatantimonas sp. YJH-8]|uniref:adenosylmethionine decarboxylase n=1 Tax=Celerinatantimonas sp. YJH-8 TaxID=3228714 RepID=UPI0038C14F0A
MFFEGSEKKIEIVIRPGVPSLRTLGQDYWKALVHTARAEILSVIHNEQCDAYLLSESSLFVWDNRCLMLTCGTTTLVDAALKFIGDQGPSQIDFFSYQRKNEYRPNLQLSTVTEDLERLRALLPMKACQFGYLDSHHHFLFSMAHPDYQPEIDDHTSELLMYHISGPAADALCCSCQELSQIRQLLDLEKLLPGFELDDFLFDPCGYSVNAIKGHQYATIHITPQQSSSYVSFETNIDLGLEGAWIVEALLKRLQPRSWDTIGFNSSPQTPKRPYYLSIGECQVRLECGYEVIFSHHQDRQSQQLPVCWL